MATHFRKLGGRVNGYVPTGGCEILRPNFSYCDEIKEIDGGWSALNTCLSLKGDLITLVGMSPGTLVELAYTKYHSKYLGKNMPVVIDRNSINWEIPECISEELDLRYFNNISQLNRILGGINNG